MQASHTKPVDVKRQAFAHGSIVFDAGLLPQATLALRDPEAWPGAQLLKGQGGRGAAVLVEGSFGSGILRHYRRGGLVGRWNKDAYLYLGENRVRSLREFSLLAELYRRGLPVPRPVFAAWQRQGPWYRADLLTCLIPQTRTLATCLGQAQDQIYWERTGIMIAAFHRQGVCHADLNAHNILVDANAEIWLIDFDRGVLRHPARRWQDANLARLRRSLEKLGVFDSSRWRALLEAYHASLQGSDA